MPDSHSPRKSNSQLGKSALHWLKRNIHEKYPLLAYIMVEIAGTSRPAGILSMEPLKPCKTSPFCFKVYTGPAKHGNTKKLL